MSMLKNRLVILFALLLLAVVPFMNAAAQDQTAADVISGNADLSTLASFIETAGLTETLAGEGPLTVYAPSNEAFAALPAIVTDYLTAHPDALTAVLTTHVASESMAAADGVEGANIVTGDLAASNGVVHVIDQVLVPAQTLSEVTPAIVTGDIAIDGSSTVEPVSVAVADKFKTDGYSGNITVGESGTGGGFKAFCEDLTIDIADASRPIKSSGDAANPDELEKCVANGREPIGFRVGTDGLTIVVNPANDFATDLTSDEIVTLFSTAAKWSDVRADFPAEDIVRYIPGTDSGTYDFFVEIFFDKDGAPVQAASSLNQSENDNVLVQGVEGNQYAVGFFGYAYYQANTDKLTAVAVDGVLPTFETVEAGTYKLSRPLFIYSTATIMAEKPQVADFISYYLQNLEEVIPAVGYFPSSAQAENTTKLLFLAATANGM
jgi:phosphate transport system substrate-binding protein